MCERLKRGLLSVQPRLVLTAVGLFVAAIFSLARTMPREVDNMPTTVPESAFSCNFAPWMASALWVAFVVVMIILGLSAYFEYRRRTHDWVLVFNFVETFEKLHRGKAASFLLDKSKGASDECSALDDLLDLFEDIGFYLKGDQISSEVVHHTFEYWIRIYCQKAESYIRDKRRTEPLVWGHLDFLLNAVSRIEIRRRGGGLTPQQLRLPEEELDDRLRSELRDNPDNTHV